MLRNKTVVINAVLMNRVNLLGKSGSGLLVLKPDSVKAEMPNCASTLSSFSCTSINALGHPQVEECNLLDEKV